MASRAKALFPKTLERTMSIFIAITSIVVRPCRLSSTKERIKEEGEAVARNMILERVNNCSGVVAF